MAAWCRKSRGPYARSRAPRRERVSRPDQLFRPGSPFFLVAGPCVLEDDALNLEVADELARWPNSRAPITVKYDTIGIRPTGGQSDDAFIVRTAMAAARTLDDGLMWTPRTGASSTDANYPIAAGIQSITIDGGGSGGGAHSLSEWYDDGEDGWKGPQWALLLVLSLAGMG